MAHNNSTTDSLTIKLLFRLLPVQILLVAVNAVNGFLSSLFASNFVGTEAMGTVGLYQPISLLMLSFSTMLVSGASILCGKYMGKNETEKLNNVFSLDIVLCVLISAVSVGALLIMGVFDLSGFLVGDPQIRPMFNRYLIGQSIGILPLLLGNQLSSFLSLENQGKRTTVAGVFYIVSNAVLNYLFVAVLHMEVFGLALGSALAQWIFLLAQAGYFLSGKSVMRLSLRDMDWREGLHMIITGTPGALCYLYQTIRGLVVNGLLLAYVGSVGISAFTAANNSVLQFFWAIPFGMQAVSRMMMSISIGEEDRRTLTATMRNMFLRFVPLTALVALGIILMAEPFTRICFRDVTDPVYHMTVMGFRILPLSMPLSVISMHFASYGQASEKTVFVHLLVALDGMIGVMVFTALLIGPMGMNSVYVANVLNGVACLIYVLGYACIKNRGIPRSMEELMVISKDFGVGPDDRLDVSVTSVDDVSGITERTDEFCLSRGLSKKTANYTSLFLEEMMVNIIEYGFSNAGRKHYANAVVVYKDGGVTLCIKDDCKPFDPVQWGKMADPAEKTKNIGIRMVMGLAEDIQYQNILGLNVLTIKIA